ncbi:hypothetical protein HKD37_10G028783 [Glycine soja]
MSSSDKLDEALLRLSNHQALLGESMNTLTQKIDDLLTQEQYADGVAVEPISEGGEEVLAIDFAVLVDCDEDVGGRRSKFFGVFGSVTVLRGQLRMASSSIITPEDVLESLMNDGTIDALRLKIINQLKANEELKSTTIKMAEQSKVLNTPGAEKQTKRELFDALRQELELIATEP